MHLNNKNFIIYIIFFETYKYRMFLFKLIKKFVIYK